MAENAFESLVMQVNQKISDMDTAISKANAATAQANTAMQKANTTTANAAQAVTDANEAAQRANTEATKWEGCTVSAQNVAAGGEATAVLSEKNGVKHLSFGLVQGETGKTGPQGPAGKAGVAFRKSGTILYIETT